jgi:hypothetical protein
MTTTEPRPIWILCLMADGDGDGDGDPDARGERPLIHEFHTEATAEAAYEWFQQRKCWALMLMELRS